MHLQARQFRSTLQCLGRATGRPKTGVKAVIEAHDQIGSHYDFLSYRLRALSKPFREVTLASAKYSTSFPFFLILKG